jgi:hypothetical protein
LPLARMGWVDGSWYQQQACGWQLVPSTGTWGSGGGSGVNGALKAWARAAGPLVPRAWESRWLQLSGARQQRGRGGRQVGFALREGPSSTACRGLPS